MNISVILAHPRKGGFNRAIAAAAVETLAQNGHDVYFHDLYEENFDPVLRTEEIAKDTTLPPELEKHCHEISEADGIIVVHPNWWGAAAGNLRGWMDRVIRPGAAYESLEGDKGKACRTAC